MADYLEEKWWRAAYHEAGHVVALVSLGIVPTHVDVSIRGAGYTAVEYLPDDWTAEQDDAVTLSGIVAEHIHKGDINDIIRAIRYDLHAPSGDDGHRLKEKDSRTIARRMEELKDYFLNRRWSLVQEIAEALMVHGAIEDEDIEVIFCAVIGSKDIGRIAGKNMHPSPNFCCQTPSLETKEART